MMDFTKLQKKLNYFFKDSSIFLLALTHKSYDHETSSQGDNERLEFLGDAILDVVVSVILYRENPHANEGQLSKMRSSVVNQNSLALVAQSLELGKIILLGKGEEASGGREKFSILSSTLEALIAAIYLDGGFLEVTRVIEKFFEDFFSEKSKQLWSYDHKSQLQEEVKKRWKMNPSYHLVEFQGPDHARVFKIDVRINGKSMAIGSGSSKKSAEQAAARVALEAIKK